MASPIDVHSPASLELPPHRNSRPAAFPALFRSLFLREDLQTPPPGSGSHQNHFPTLPEEVLVYLLRFLECTDLCKVRQRPSKMRWREHQVVLPPDPRLPSCMIESMCPSKTASGPKKTPCCSRSDAPDVALSRVPRFSFRSPRLFVTSGVESSEGMASCRPPTRTRPKCCSSGSPSALSRTLERSWAASFAVKSRACMHSWRSNVLCQSPWRICEEHRVPALRTSLPDRDRSKPDIQAQSDPSSYFSPQSRASFPHAPQGQGR